MILYIGGAYQGQLELACAQAGLVPSDVQTCSSDTLELDWTKSLIHQIQLLFWAQAEQGIDSLAYLRANLDRLSDKIILLEDISAGIVPIDPKQRAWRETTGRCSVFLASQSEQVIRVFCGIGTPIKPC